MQRARGAHHVAKKQQQPPPQCAVTLGVEGQSCFNSAKQPEEQNALRMNRANDTGDRFNPSEAKRRKLLEVYPEASTNQEPLLFRTSIVPWWAWLKRSDLPEAELLNGLLVTVISVVVLRRTQDVQSLKKIADEEATLYDRQWKFSWEDQNEKL
ncbi:hypothetical protein SLEP1_g52580 [Rubroshorea leprosula]|uniref:Uncharacterized protein n=1 Tax=Rubroshorea leprosula TaxID=152421 RepID=A0AAV5M7M9_9ROSI|nr:hypothetical protein SLEP1_g52580 [Rubroshorea leprosula]